SFRYPRAATSPRPRAWPSPQLRGSPSPLLSGAPNAPPPASTTRSRRPRVAPSLRPPSGHAHQHSCSPSSALHLNSSAGLPARAPTPPSLLLGVGMLHRRRVGARDLGLSLATLCRRRFRAAH